MLEVGFHVRVVETPATPFCFRAIQKLLTFDQAIRHLPNILRAEIADAVIKVAF